MIQIRNSVFETNSSSTHSICISKKPVKNLPYRVCFTVDEYGWEEDDVYDTASYLWTAILDCPDEEEHTQKLKDALDRLGVQYVFKYPRKSKDGRYMYGGIDHGFECCELIDALLSDDDLLARYLFSDSVIYTGNDNSSEWDSKCWSADEYVWDDDHHQEVPNPNHHPDKYDYFFKGN